MSSRRTIAGARTPHAPDTKKLRAVRVRSDPVHGNGRCALRAPSLVRQRRRSARRRRARALRGRGPLGARRPVTALGAHGEDVRAPESQARLLPLHGVPDRALAGQQHHEPAARSRGAARSRTKASIGWACSSRSPTPVWATAAWAAWRRASSTRWRRCSCRPWATGLVRIRHLQAGHPGRLAARAAGQLAALPDPGEVARPYEKVEIKMNCAVEVRAGTLQPVIGQPRT